MRDGARNGIGPGNQRTDDRLRRLENMRASEIPIETIAAISAAQDVQAALELLSVMGGGSAWGDITGTLSDQLDLQAELDAKLDAASYTAADVLAKLLTVDGAGSGLDADLLDGQNGAYYLPAASYTAADVLAKLLTVDGAGSGLDADTLDGLSSAAFATAAHTHTLDSLSDVDTATVPPTTGQALVWDGAQWEPGSVATGGSMFRANRTGTMPSNVTGAGTFYTMAYNNVLYPQSWASLDTATGIVTLAVGVYIVNAAVRLDGGAATEDWWTAHIGINGSAEYDPFGSEYLNEAVAIPFAHSIVTMESSGTVQFVFRVGGGGSNNHDVTLAWIQIAKIG